MLLTADLLSAGSFGMCIDTRACCLPMVIKNSRMGVGSSDPSRLGACCAELGFQTDLLDMGGSGRPVTRLDQGQPLGCGMSYHSRPSFSIQVACCAELGFQMDLLDIGGGFCSGAGFAGGVPVAVNSALAEHFPASLGAQIIAEPGRWGLCCIEEPFTIKICALDEGQQCVSICLGPSALRVPTRFTRAYIRKYRINGAHALLPKRWL